MSEKGLETSVDTNEMGSQTARAFNGNIDEKCNFATVSGVFEEEFQYSHETFGERFYRSCLRVTRTSGTNDFVPILVSGNLLANGVKSSVKGKCGEVRGKLRSYRILNPKDSSFHKELFVFATSITIYESGESFENTNLNQIYLKGVICDPAIYRQTPFGRQITDFSMTVKRTHDKFSFIPCIAWGRNAVYTSYFKVGDMIEIWGRIQSRQYFKRYSPYSEAGEYKTVHEVSIIDLIRVENL